MSKLGLASSLSSPLNEVIPAANPSVSALSSVNVLAMGEELVEVARYILRNP